MTIYCLKPNPYFISSHHQLWQSLWDGQPRQPWGSKWKKKKIKPSFPPGEKLRFPYFWYFLYSLYAKQCRAWARIVGAKRPHIYVVYQNAKSYFFTFILPSEGNRTLLHSNHIDTLNIHISSNKTTPQITLYSDLLVLFSQERLCDLSLFLT